MSYAKFLDAKAQIGSMDGFTPLWLPEFLFDFQRALVEWAVRKGRAAIFADCGMGKTPMQLVWAENIVRHTNGRVLIATPLAVAHQTVEEANKFGIEARRESQGALSSRIIVTNYERLHYFRPEDFAGMVCDESSILKNYDGARRGEITEFMKKMRYRLLCTATAAPNDYIELGTSSEALGELGFIDMLGRFFKNDQNTSTSDRGRKWLNHGGEAPKWRFKGHAEQAFWRWVASWARALRRPSDLGFDDGEFILPVLTQCEHEVTANSLPDGYLFTLPAVGLYEQREERRRTIKERCERAAALVNATGNPALVWCQLNDEGDLLERLMPGCVQVAGKDSDDEKEEKLLAFAHKQARVLVTKPKIAGYGLNLQHCAHVTFFPSHSFEQYYQGVRRCWRFGQTQPVKVDVIATEGDRGVMANLQRKAQAADRMFDELVKHMNEAVTIRRGRDFHQKERIPQWMTS